MWIQSNSRTLHSTILRIELVTQGTQPLIYRHLVHSASSGALDMRLLP